MKIWVLTACAKGLRVSGAFADKVFTVDIQAKYPQKKWGFGQLNLSKFSQACIGRNEREHPLNF